MQLTRVRLLEACIRDSTILQKLEGLVSCIFVELFGIDFLSLPMVFDWFTPLKLFCVVLVRRLYDS